MPPDAGSHNKAGQQPEEESLTDGKRRLSCDDGSEELFSYPHCVDSVCPDLSWEAIMTEITAPQRSGPACYCAVIRRGLDGGGVGLV